MPSGGVGEPQVQQRDLAAFLFYYITLILLDRWQATCISSREHCFVYLFACLLYFIVCLFVCLFLLLLLLLLLSPDCQNANSKMTSIEVLKLMLDSCSSGCPGGGRFRKEARWWFHFFSIGGGFKYFAYILGGGFIFFLVTPIWGRFPFWRTYFSDGLKPPTRKSFTSCCVVFFFLTIKIIQRSLNYLPILGEWNHANDCNFEEILLVIIVWVGVI